MNQPAGSSIEHALAAFYNQQAATRDSQPTPPRRLDAQSQFIALLKSEGRHNLLDLGCGPGADGLRFVKSGIHYAGVDLSEEHVRLARSKGLEATVASGRSLPFPDNTFAAVWTMSTLLHVPNQEIDDVVRELKRVTAPGAPIAVGLWSGDDTEALNPHDVIEPHRFFSRRSDGEAQRIFEAHGEVELFLTWPEGAGIEAGPGAGHWTQHYQFLILRTPS